MDQSLILIKHAVLNNKKIIKMNKNSHNRSQIAICRRLNTNCIANNSLGNYNSQKSL
jgi:hypothetical protein